MKDWLLKILIAALLIYAAWVFNKVSHMKDCPGGVAPASQIRMLQV